MAATPWEHVVIGVAARYEDALAGDEDHGDERACGEYLEHPAGIGVAVVVEEANQLWADEVEQEQRGGGHEQHGDAEALDLRAELFGADLARAGVYGVEDA